MSNYVKTPVLRGFTEIRAIWDIVHPNNAYIAGGYARYMASPQQYPPEAADVDVFPADGDDTRLANAFYERGYYLAGETDNAVTLRYSLVDYTVRSTLLGRAPGVQIIKRPFVLPTIEETLDHFDFTVVAAAILSPETALVHPCFHEHEDMQQLHILHTAKGSDPIRTIMRAMKYYKRGYSIQPIEFANLFDSSTEWEIDFPYWDRLADNYNEWEEF